jgi:drug/metabolite transporter (DMT)-like permease
MLQVAIARINLLPVYSGVLALVATLLIWSSFFVALRSGAQSALTSFDMALLRFVFPAIILLPVLIKSKKKILQCKKRYLLGICVGAGLPFYLICVIASGNVQAVVGSLLVPGVAPVFVTLMAVLCYRERLAKRKTLGLSIVITGITLLVLSNLQQTSEASMLGAVLYIIAAACWATYTISIKLTKLSGLEIAAVLNGSAAAILLLIFPFNVFTSNIANVSFIAQVLPQLLVMGVFCGLISVITYGHAINKLGAELSACWGATTPILVSILAFLLLNEALQMETIIAMLAIISGVICANFKRK